MIIKPYSSVAQDAFISSSYPSVKHFFPCNEAAGTNTLTDVVGGVVINYAGLTRTSDGFGADTSSTAAQNTSGTWSTPGSKLWVMLVVGTYSNTVTNALTFGISGSSTHDRVIMTGSAMQVSDPNANATVDGGNITLPANGSIGGRAMVVNAYDNASGFTTYQFDTASLGAAISTVGTRTEDTGGTSAYASGSGLEMGTGGFQIGGSASALYGIAWFEFSSLPSDLLVGLAWMTAKWAAGVKAIYPGWKNKS